MKRLKRYVFCLSAFSTADDGDFPLRKEPVNSFFTAVYHATALKVGFAAIVCEALKCVCVACMPKPCRVFPELTQGFVVAVPGTIPCSTKSNGLLARASSVAVLHHGDEPALYALLPDVVRALLAQLACVEPVGQDSASQRRTIQLQTWRSLHAPTSCVHNTSMDPSIASEADSEVPLLAGLGEAVGEFAF